MLRSTIPPLRVVASLALACAASYFLFSRIPRLVAATATGSSTRVSSVGDTAAKAAPFAGSVLLLYKSTTHDRDTLKYGVARARHFRGPYERVGVAPIKWSDDPGGFARASRTWSLVIPLAP